MPNPGYSGPDDPRLVEVREAMKIHKTAAAAARALGLPSTTFDTRLAAARKWQEADPAIAEAAKAGGLETPANLSHFWKIVKDEDGNGYSLFVKNPDTGAEQDLKDVVRGAISDALEGTKPKLQIRDVAGGDHLLIIDLADVHFMKLCVETETGYSYSREEAIHRVVSGTEALLQSAKGFGIGRVLFVLGNDILHVDNASKTTTSGTPQDTEGSVYQGWRDAFQALKYAIEECAKVAEVDLIFCPSNHDWVLGWTPAQGLSAYFAGHPHVHSSDYAISERHRKYYRYGRNLIGLSHGDGAKEEQLYSLMVTEAAGHVGEARNRYWLLHHVHHKQRKRRGPDVFLSEKDHIGMTSIHTGHTSTEAHCHVEYVRSPSPPDGWHDRNGYVNRQGVECFLFHAGDGMKARFSEWF